MKIQNLIAEAPLPDDWDKDLYSHGKGSFKRRIEYAKQQAQKIGGGSSRIAFLIKYEGRDTVLKIAKNKKGLAQNYQEATMLRTAEVLGGAGKVVVPMIDHDETGEDPSWLHVEYARKLKNEQEFEILTGFKLSDLLDYAAQQFGNKSVSGFRQKKEFDSGWKDKMWEEDSFANELMNFIGNTDLHLSDLYRVNNWGVYKNNPVIIDLGLDQEIYNKYYKGNF